MLQALTIVSKALLLFTMSYYLSVRELGIFGLMLVATNMMMYLLGMEFYTFNRRAILYHHENDVPRLFRDQLVFHGIIYLLILPQDLPVLL
jgi:O-antigen/teichoic acid export membrane protein